MTNDAKMMQKQHSEDFRWPEVFFYNSSGLKYIALVWTWNPETSD